MNTENTNKDGQITKEVFDTFFHENYCPLEYPQIQHDFEEAASSASDLFTDSCDFSTLTRDNFYLYMTNDAYCIFESIVEEAFDDLNPEIVDAVMDLSATVSNADDITEQYWSTCDNLLHLFLLRLYDENISKQIAAILAD